MHQNTSFLRIFWKPIGFLTDICDVYQNIDNCKMQIKTRKLVVFDNNVSEEKVPPRVTELHSRKEINCVNCLHFTTIFQTSG